MENSLSMLKIQRDELTKDIKIKTANNESKTNRILGLEMENSKVLEEINSLISEREDLLNKQRRLEIQIKSLEESRLQFTEKEKSLQEMEYRFKLEIETVTRRSEEQRIEMAKVEKERTSLLKELEDLRRSKKNNLEEDMRMLKVEKLRFEDERKKLQLEHEKTTYKYESLIRIEKERAEKYRFELESERRSLNNIKHEGQAEGKEMIRKLESQLSNLKSQYLRSENTLVKEKTELMEKIRNLKDDYEKRINGMEMGNKRSLEAAYQHQCSLTSSMAMTKEIEKLREHYDKEKREIEEMYIDEKGKLQEEWQRKLKEEKDSWEIQLHRLQSELDISTKEKFEADNKVREIRAEFQREEENMKRGFVEEKTKLTLEFEAKFEALRKEQTLEYEMFVVKEKEKMEQKIKFYEIEIEKLKMSQHDSKLLRESLSREKALKEKLYELEEANSTNTNRILELERQLMNQKVEYENKLDHVIDDAKRDNEELKRRLEHEREMVEISRDGLQKELDKIKNKHDNFQGSVDRWEHSTLELQQKFSKAEKRIRELELKLEEMKRKERELKIELHKEHNEKLSQEKRINESNMARTRSEMLTIKESRRKLEIEFNDLTVTCEKLKQRIQHLEEEVGRRGSPRGRDVSHLGEHTKACGCSFYVYPERHESPRNETQVPQTGRYYEYGYAMANRIQVCI